MGVDIYGLNPGIPEFSVPENATAEQINELELVRAEALLNTPGGYFQNNWWNWRPIQLLIEVLNDVYNIGIPADEIESLGDNSGIGVSSPEHCQTLASYIDEYVDFMRVSGFSVVYLNNGFWYMDHGRKVSDDSIVAKIDKQYPRGLLFEKPVIDGVEYKPSHSTNIDNLRAFSEFLKFCNGFAIY